MASRAPNVLYPRYATHYITMVRGDGVYMYDDDGYRYLDAIVGVGVVNIGHGVPEVVNAMARQVRELSVSHGGLVDNRLRQALARKLHVRAPPGMRETQTLFTSGGAEANEAALRLAYQYHWERAHPTKSKVIGRWHSYHGNIVRTQSCWRCAKAPPTRAS